MRSKALREQRAKLIADAREILDAADNQKRAMSADETAKYDAIMVDVDRLKGQIERVDRQETLESEERYAAAASPAAAASESRAREEGPSAELRDRAFMKWAVSGAAELTAEERQAINFGRSEDGPGLKLRFERPGPSGLRLHLATKRSEAMYEARAQSVGTNSTGGYTVARAFSNELEKALLAFGPMLDVARIIDTDTGAALDWPTVNDTAQAGARLAENTGVTTQDITFGTVTLNAYKYSSKQVLVPVELMQDSAFNVDSEVGAILGERLGRILNTEMTTGTGSSQPNGVVTAATLGKTGTTGQTTTVIYDDLVDLFHSVNRAYRVKKPGVGWMMADSSVKVVRKLKDSQNRPLWEQNMQAGTPDLLMGYPLYTNDDVAAMAANAKSILFGDFTKYAIRRVKDITIIRLNERYADSHQVGFIGFARFDGNLINAGTNPVKYYANSAT